MKQQVEALIQENTILKRAVSIQHERQKDYDDRSQELENLKQLLSQYQEQLRTLEVDLLKLDIFLKFYACSNRVASFVLWQMVFRSRHWKRKVAFHENS